MSPVLEVAVLAAGLALVIGGAELFFKAVLSAATRFRISVFVFTALISGFEIENLAAGIAANLKGLPDAAAGTFLGGTSFLALGVAGAGALIAPTRASLPGPVLAWAAAAPLPLLVLSLDRTISRQDGVLLLVWFAIAMLGTAHAGREVGGQEEVQPRVRAPLARLVGGLALLSVGGELLGEGIRSIVRRFGVSEALLGNTALAASVEAEELGRFAVPAKRGRGDVAFANILGTIAHFVAFNVAVIAIVRPMRLSAASVHLHVPVAAASPTILAVIVARRRGLSRGDGAALLALYAIYVAGAVVLA